MKKILLSAALFTLMLASCSKENVKSELDETKTFQASIENPSLTKTSLGDVNGETTPVKWMIGDEVAVTETADNVVTKLFKVESINESGSAVLVGAIADYDQYLAISPFSAFIDNNYYGGIDAVTFSIEKNKHM